jgi:hypothetical protein
MESSEPDGADNPPPKSTVDVPAVLDGAEKHAGKGADEKPNTSGAGEPKPEITDPEQAPTSRPS